MGDPAEISPADRAATRDLAERIVQSVVDDEAMPLGVPERDGLVRWGDVQDLAFRLAQELVQTRRELEEALDIAFAVVRKGVDSTTPTRRKRLARIQELRGKGRLP